MSDSYVDDKVREALAACSGSRGQAQLLLIRWAIKDQRLLLGMCQPFLKAISTAAVERVVRRGGATPMAARTAQPAAVLPKDVLNSVLDRIGQGGLGGGLGGGSSVGFGGGPAPVSVSARPEPGQATSQEASLRTIAAAFGRKPGRPMR
ncbi:conserved hypothetical protein [uncultured Gammaproteobacteria bacterium]